MGPIPAELLSAERLADYEAVGYVDSIPILTPDEVLHYRELLEATRAALPGRAVRLDGLHLFFRWAWDLATHPRLLDCMADLLGPNILLKSTRIFCKLPRSEAYVGWHQDGITEKVTDPKVPAVWLGLTDATIENGCLRVVPRSHRVGMLEHADTEHEEDLASCGTNASHRGPGSHQTGQGFELNDPHDVVMRAGEMSFHHPLVLHGSNPNRSDGPRIGLSATYCPPESHTSGAPAALVRGTIEGPGAFEVSDVPTLSFAEAVDAYRASGRQMLTMSE